MISIGRYGQATVGKAEENKDEVANNVRRAEEQQVEQSVRSLLGVPLHRGRQVHQAGGEVGDELQLGGVEGPKGGGEEDGGQLKEEEGAGEVDKHVDDDGASGGGENQIRTETCDRRLGVIHGQGTDEKGGREGEEGPGTEEVPVEGEQCENHPQRDAGGEAEQEEVAHQAAFAGHKGGRGGLFEKGAFKWVVVVMVVIVVMVVVMGAIVVVIMVATTAGCFSQFGVAAQICRAVVDVFGSRRGARLFD